ncbi:MAG: hypothetical protein AABO58_25410 [Acidobacteriota bacterium]
MRKALGLLLITCVTGAVACKSETTTNNLSDTSATTMTDTSATTSTMATDLTGTSTTGTMVAESHSIGLVDATNAEYVTSSWAGTGNSGTMTVRIVNRTEREWLIHVDVGTKLEPSNSGVQSMVVTEELHVTMHPHDSQTLDVEVSCLDISKDTPDTTDRGWSANVSTGLAAFIGCVKGGDDADKLQIAVWAARGATREQWVDYFVTYQGASRAEALQMAIAAEDDGRAILARCPSS